MAYELRCIEIEKIMKEMEKNLFTCCLCCKTGKGFGNNPFPVANEGKCCDSCNITVIRARIDSGNYYPRKKI